MARIQYWQYLLDNQGNPLNSVDVRVYLAGTVKEADIYLDATFGSVTKSSTVNLKTNRYGFVNFWIGDRWEVEGGYNETQAFKIVWENIVDGISEEIDNLYIFTPVRPIVVTDSIKGVPSNKDKDKVISNEQGYNWDTHTDQIVPSASPHGLTPVTFFDLDEVQNKVISNKLGYQMHQIATTSSSISVDVSGAGIYTTNASWSVSGAVYYADITHNLNNYYPVVELMRNDNNTVLTPVLIKSLSEDVVRVWYGDNISINVRVLG